MRLPSIPASWLLGAALGLAPTSAVPAADRISTAAVSPAAIASQVATATDTQPAASTASSTPAVAAAVKHVRLPLLSTAIPAEKFRLYDAAGRLVAATLRASHLEAEVQTGRVYVLVPPAQGRQTLKPPAAHVAMKGDTLPPSTPGAHVAMKGDTVPPSTRAARLEFPARYVAFDKNGNPFNEGGLFLRAQRVPLVWDDAKRAYATDLIVGYDFTDGHEQALPAAKTVTLFAEGPDARIQADTVTITRSGVPGYQRVVLTTRQTDGETLFTARASPLDELQAAATIDREPARLELTLPSRQIDAFGLGTGTLTVRLLAKDGLPLAANQPLQIQLSSRRLRLPPTVNLAAGQSTATAEFRSLGYGRDEIQAAVGSLTGSLPVAAVFPLAALVAAVVGGALGGGARYLRNKRRKSPLLVRRLAEGIVVGTLFVGAAWAGLVAVEINAGILNTPFGGFVLAAFSGYLGCAVLDRVAARMLPPSTAAT